MENFFRTKSFLGLGKSAIAYFHHIDPNNSRHSTENGTRQEVKNIALWRVREYPADVVESKQAFPAMFWVLAFKEKVLRWLIAHHAKWANGRRQWTVCKVDATLIKPENMIQVRTCPTCFTYYWVPIWQQNQTFYGQMQLKLLFQKYGSRGISGSSRKKSSHWSNVSDSIRVKASSWRSHSKLYNEFSLQDICLNWHAFVSSPVY